MRVMVAMSGGVDSSVAAAMMVEEGHDQIHAKMFHAQGIDLHRKMLSGKADKEAERFTIALDAQVADPFHPVEVLVEEVTHANGKLHTRSS